VLRSELRCERFGIYRAAPEASTTTCGAAAAWPGRAPDGARSRRASATRAWIRWPGSVLRA